MFLRQHEQKVKRTEIQSIKRLIILKNVRTHDQKTNF